MMPFMVDGVKIGTGGRLYKDAREAGNGRRRAPVVDLFPGEDVDGAYLPTAEEEETPAPEPAPEPPPPPKQHAETRPSHPPQPHYVIEPILPPPPPAEPSPRNWRQLSSTAAELLGIIIMSVGFGMMWLPLGVALFGLCVIILAVASDPQPPQLRRRPVGGDR